MTTDYPGGWFWVFRGRVLHYFKERGILSQCMQYNRKQILLGPSALKSDQKLCKKCSSEITKRYWNLDKKGQEIIDVVCDGKRPDNEVIQEAVDWAEKGTEEKPRLVFVKKS